jgi:REP element-mobilizing transposase RayT
MPRQARLDAPGSLHHVIIRGIERKKIFFVDTDKDDLLDRLSSLIPKTQMVCYAWCLMPNHAHFLFRSGGPGISQLMRRLLTGYVVHLNRKYKRHGPLFQNRFKSVLCQEDLYLMELIRYIHLNPLRANIVRSLEELNTFKYCGHGTLVGEQTTLWQDTEYALSLFGDQAAMARKKYQDFVKAGVEEGRNPELTGGGLVKSIGGWQELKQVRKAGQDRIKGDERILGDYSFVSSVLSKSKQAVSVAYELKAKGIDFAELENQVTSRFNIEKSELYSKNRKKPVVRARSILFYWANRKLDISCTELARRFKLSQPAVSYAIERAEQMADELNLELPV